jgi:hypothetical protein
MLRFDKAPPAPERVEFAAGAYALIRAATSIDYERARDQAQTMIVAIADSEEAAKLYASAAGLPEIGEITAADVATAAGSLSLVFLACRCITEIGGIAIGDEMLKAPLKPDQTAVILRDTLISQKVSEKVFASIAVETSEGNGSPPSRDGAPGAGERTAGTAGRRARRAPKGSPAPAASSVQSTSTVQ